MKRLDFNLLKRNRRRIIVSADDLLTYAVEYFEWCDDNPLQEEKVFHYQGDIVRADVEKVRAYTKKGLSTHLGVSETVLDGFRRRGPDWAEVVDWVEQVIYTQKFENAAAGLLNASLISRDLGLSDKQEISGTADSSNPPPLNIQIVPVQSGTYLPPES